MDLALGPAAAPVGGQGREAVRVQEVRWRDRARVQGRIQVGSWVIVRLSLAPSTHQVMVAAALAVVLSLGLGLAVALEGELLL